MKKLLLIALFVVACGPPVNEGTLIKKEFVAAHDEDRTNYGVCLIRSGTKLTDPCIYYLHYTEHVDDTCYFTLQNAAKETDTHTVSCNIFNKYNEGDYLTFK